MVAFINLADQKLNTNFGLKQLQQKGALVYEYNPLRVMRINKDVKLGTDDKLKDFGYPAGTLVNLDTNDLGFDLNHPVDIVTQQSYDGSINLVLNDGVSNPKLINTRFSSTGMDTYQIVDREGDNDSNIYDVDSFKSDTSLYKKTNTISKLTFKGLNTGGNLKVGNYVFYFRLADADGNETDFVAESSIVTCHMGNLNDPFSIQGGIADENSYKSVSFLLYSIDSSYNNVTIYYTRSTSDIDGNEITTSFKLLKQFPVYNNMSNITVTGFENSEPVSINDINAAFNVVDSANSQTTCQNMLFLGNVKNPEIDYKELTDLSLYFLTDIDNKSSIGRVNESYADPSGNYEYYNVSNIYNKLGYWNDEIYRLGVVYILNDFTLSPVFNIRGNNSISTSSNYVTYALFKDPENPEDPKYKYDDSHSIDEVKANRKYIVINKESYKLESPLENSKGVIQLKYTDSQLGTETTPLGFSIKIIKDAASILKRLTRGFFFVRQKRIPTTLCQAVTIGLDKSSYLPIIPVSRKDYLVERFLDDDKVLTHDLSRRYKTISASNVLEGSAALCPEFELRTSYFNQLFTGTEFTTVVPTSTFAEQWFTRSGNHCYNVTYKNENSIRSEVYNITAVNDSTKVIKGKNQLFSARAGEAEEAWRVSYYNNKDKSSSAVNLLRGNWGPYLGLEGFNTSKMCLVDIKIPNYDESQLDTYFQIRYEDSSSFYAISDRMAWEDISFTADSVVIDNIFRGDCYIGNYTHRVCRNFQDPSAPINDDIVDQMSWRDNYTVGDSEKNAKINRGDVNAVQMGHWVTIKVCSNVNLSMRCTDKSYTSEVGLIGKARGFYPLQSMSTTGESKVPESFVVNAGINSTTSDKYYFETPNVPAIKNAFHIRIMYSDINVNDSFKNGYRVFRIQNYRDYPVTYGSIIKLVEWFGNIICVFEHGVALIPVNERVQSGDGMGGNVFINTSNVLPENPKMLSDTFGTQWAESVIKTPYYVYGVDTVGKKIWRTNGQVFETISDFKVQKFLNDNISLTAKEKTPIIGIRNVKTHYNRFKQDVMFTFYDDINTLEENVWNLCYNEVMQKFITFYSWIPSYSENVDNIFFTFDRNTSKAITRLSSNYPLVGINFSGALGSKIGGNLVVVKNIGDPISGLARDGESYQMNPLGSLVLNLKLDGYKVEYDIADENITKRYYITHTGDDPDTGEWNILALNPEVKNEGQWTIPLKITIYNNGEQLVEGASRDIYKTLYGNLVITSEANYENLTTHFWKHGRAGLMETRTKLSPCMWYGNQHPFEFEFVVVDNPSTHKIFNALQIISNKAQPESFHFEVVGEVYNFASDKKNMYFRQEATKHLYQFNGGDIVFNHDYLEVKPEQRDILYSSSPLKEMSVMFPLMFSRVDTLNEIEDHYQSMTALGKNYQYISGSEIVHDDQLNEYKIATHIKGCPFRKIYKQEIDKGRYDELQALGYHNCKEEKGKYYEYMEYGRVNGNMDYLEDKWDIQIPSITYWVGNEPKWEIEKDGTRYPPLNLTNNPLPEDMPSLTIEDGNIPPALQKLGYKADLASIDVSKWDADRKETRIRDKYVKIKVRYTGDELSVITALKTLYTISYA